jgi:hypothetical protein
MLGSLITRPLRIATRSVTIPYRLTRGAIEVAEGVAGLVLLRLRQHDDSSPGEDRATAEPTAWRPPAPNTMEQEPEAAPAPRARAPRRESTNGNSATSPPRPGRPRQAAPAPPKPEPSAPEPPQPAPPPAPDPVAPAPPVASPPPAIAEPAHVSSEVELVEESADPGAADGAGAQIRIGEPWEGYRQMKAPDIVDRLASASREEIAAVELFEAVGRKRKSVLTAAERALRQLTPPSPQSPSPQSP